MAEQVTPPVDPAADQKAADQGAPADTTSAPTSTNGSADPAAPDTNPDSAPSTQNSPSAPAAPAEDEANAPAQPTTPSQGSESVPGATEAKAPAKAAARKGGATQKPGTVKDKAAPVPPEASTTPQNAATVGPLPHGVVPDQVQINQSLAQVLNDLEAFKVRAARLLSGYDYAKLIAHVETAQDWVADRLGLKKADNGGYVNPDQATSQPDQSQTS
jgi:hypothetical protein